MKKQSIASYLRDLERALRLKGFADTDTLAEIEGHLLEAVERSQRQGLTREEAEQHALQRFGSVKAVTFSFEKERNDTMQKVLLAIAILFGILIAYVDSRPGWDDTGITAGALLLSSGLITLLGYKRPWLSALALALWLPVYETIRSQNFSLPGVILFPILITMIALVGAYAGWAVRLGLRNTFHTA